MYKIAGAVVLDLDNLRTAVANGKSMGEAFADLFTEKLKSNAYYSNRIKKATNNGGQTVGISFKAITAGSEGNIEKLFLAQGQLRSYTLDYGKWFTENPNLSIPDFLNNKGFRAYCASCDNQVFNFHFITDDLPEGPRPEADPTGEDIKHIYINVSNVTDASSLVQAIVEQATPELTGSDPDLNHFMRLVADDDKLIIYDERRLMDNYLRYARDASGNLLYEYQWDDTEQVGGAKIADGVWDNVEIGERKIYAKDLIIHHTDRASMNIHLKIPQTTLDHLFDYEPGSQDWTEFNVMTSKSREELLGNWAGTTRSGKHIAKDEEGLLDRALNYLIGANCLVGAQNMRLKMTEENIVAQREGTVASESTIRDANMAKEMTDYTKANVLAQASQSMLAQANQNSSGVLKLLQ
ncbi:flagellin [Selenomonas sp.]|uniref:flagellin n=1 Tax=Selenomonas sp. TaxID=2053611 RepID=UPI0025E0E80D|nr:flagellin [Selenomonas sp.]